MWVTREPKQRKVLMMDVGPAVLHSVICWICNEQSAVYSMPDWIFKPCWDCQSKLGMIGIQLQKKKKWYEFCK